MPSAACAARRTQSSRLLNRTAKLEAVDQALLLAQKRAQIRVPSFLKDARSPPTPKLSLPRTLPRPAATEVHPRFLGDAYPELAGVPAEYIRQRLPLKCTTMRAALDAVRPAFYIPTNYIPARITILVNATVAAACPTHMLAVHGGDVEGTDATRTQRVTLFPTHDLVLRSHCAALSTHFLPPSRPSAETLYSSTTLPVVPLRLPSPETFDLLHTFLYTQQIALQPPPHADILALAAHAHKIHGLWRNACALGVVDETLHVAIEKAWAVTLEEMQACR